MITLTDAAAGKVRELLASEGADDLALRVAVRPGGCSGFSYEMFFDGEFAADDQQATFGDSVKVVVDPQSAQLLDGATLDYKDGLDQSGFAITNPNATRARCGLRRRASAGTCPSSQASLVLGGDEQAAWSLHAGGPRRRLHHRLRTGRDIRRRARRERCRGTDRAGDGEPPWTARRSRRRPDRRGEDALLPHRHGHVRHVQRGVHRRVRRPSSRPLDGRRRRPAGRRARSRSRPGRTGRHDGRRRWIVGQRRPTTLLLGEQQPGDPRLPRPRMGGAAA